MSNIKNKDMLFAVVRRDITGMGEVHHEAICCFTRTPERAQELADSYTQEWIDRNIQPKYFDFYVVGNVFYDE